MDQPMIHALGLWLVIVVCVVLAGCGGQVPAPSREQADQRGADAQPRKQQGRQRAEAARRRAKAGERAW